MLTQGMRMTSNTETPPPHDGESAVMLPPEPVAQETARHILLNWTLMILGLGAVAGLGVLLPKLM
jgi:hypothetical protein